MQMNRSFIFPRKKQGITLLTNWNESDFMNYIVLDLEWNQSPHGKEGTIEHFPFEIIEIGAVKLDETFCEIGEFHRLISPVAYPQLHFKISEVTQLDMRLLRQNGIPFKEAAYQFLEWCGNDFIFVTWGSMDLTELQRNMVYSHMPIPFKKPLLYYDLQKLYSLLYDDGNDKLSLDQAVEALAITFDEDRPFHHALDDAFYTGQVMAKMDFKKVSEYVSTDYYRLPQTEQEQIYLTFSAYTKFVSREFPTKEEAMADKRVNEVICCLCRRTLRKKIRWFSANSKLYLCLALCPEHGFVRGKIRIKKAESGNIFAIRTTKIVDASAANLIAEKREEYRKRRTEKNKHKRQSKKSRTEE